VNARFTPLSINVRTTISLVVGICQSSPVAVDLPYSLSQHFFSKTKLTVSQLACKYF
jgi:hypothetical protein